MSSDGAVGDDSQLNPDEVTKGQLVELYESERAHREKLEEQMEALSERLDKIQKTTVTEGVVNQLIAALVNDGGAVDFVAEPMANRDVLEDFGRRVGSVEVEMKRVTSRVNDVYDDGVDGPRAAWESIVELANQKRGNPKHKLPNNRVKLYRENIADATGKSERQASNYIEEFGEQKEGADWQPYRRGSAGNKGNARKKGLIVDLDVWGEDDE